MKTRPLGSFGSWAIKVAWQERWGPQSNDRRNVVCRFYPSCSQYGRIAMEQYGLRIGATLAYRRVKRCVPGNTDSCVDFP
jgi:hypothetical protein